MKNEANIKENEFLDKLFNLDQQVRIEDVLEVSKIPREPIYFDGAPVSSYIDKNTISFELNHNPSQ